MASQKILEAKKGAGTIFFHTAICVAAFVKTTKLVQKAMESKFRPNV